MTRFGRNLHCVLLMCSSVLISCRIAENPPVPDDGPNGIHIVVSLPVVGLITEPLLPDGMSWSAVLPAGGSPHAFEPSPSHGVLVSRSPVLIAVHPHVDGWASRLTRGATIHLESGERHAHGDHEHENGHIWMDPVHVRAIIGELGRELCMAVPETCPDMHDRVAAFSDTLHALDRELVELLSTASPSSPRRPLLTALPFIHPLLDRYDVAYEGPVQRVPGDMVAPSELARLLRASRDQGTRAFVSQQSMMSSALGQIASDAGLELVMVEPTGHGFDSYTAFIRETARKIHAAR
ncbi:MAG: hypothetical protein COV99_03275 [Bacteroidetes bacterium CG12_big_fil_rev_8_21_14_0_65_60_17]|nr:MAG: hypothetical protein COV99_03275 [Bacteroidetes bacterium CG12_big_fil_rev_8_21_14_0_65_60_17]